MSNLDPGLIAAFVMASIFINLIALVIMTCMARKKVDSLLSRCAVVRDLKLTFGGLGFAGDVIRMGVVCSIFVVPKAFSKRKIIDEEQIKMFPRKLKTLMVSVWLFGFITAFAMVIFRFYIYFYDIHFGRV